MIPTGLSAAGISPVLIGIRRLSTDITSRLPRHPQHPCILTCHSHSPIQSADKTTTTLHSPTLTWHYPQQPEAFNNPTLYSLSAEKSFHPILTCRLPSGLRPATAILLRILILYRKIDEETTSFLLFFAPFSFFTIEDLAVVGYETHGTGEGYSCGSVTQRSHQV